MNSRVLLLLCCGLLASCAAHHEPAPLASTNPASASAEKAPYLRPKQILAREPEVAPSKQKQAALYVCPMHPEVRSDKPGECPKCGMALVKQ